MLVSWSLSECTIIVLITVQYYNNYVLLIGQFVVMVCDAVFLYGEDIDYNIV